MVFRSPDHRFLSGAFGGIGRRICPGKKDEDAAGSREKVPAREGQAGKGTSESAVVKIGSGEPSPGQINARSAILVEVSTGAVLFEQNADEVIEPASFTKIASLYMVFDGLRQGRVSLADEVWVSETAWRTGGSKMFVGVGTKVPLEELVKGSPSFPEMMPAWLRQNTSAAVWTLLWMP